MKIAYTISCLILWVCCGLNCWAMIRNLKLSRQYQNAISSLMTAKNRCDDTAQQLDKVLDELQKNGVEAALAVFEKEDAAE